MFTHLQYARFGYTRPIIVVCGFIEGDTVPHVISRSLLGEAKRLFELGQPAAIIIDRIEDYPEEVNQGCPSFPLVIEDLRMRYPFFG